MQLNACILIKTTPLKLNEIRDGVKRLKGVRKAFLVYGRFDLIVFAEAAEYPEVRKLTGLINSMDGVRSTETLVEA